MSGVVTTLNAINYEIVTTSVDLDTSLPVIDHLTGYTKAYLLVTYTLTLSDGSFTTISTGDMADLVPLGVTIIIDHTAGTALLKIN